MNIINDIKAVMPLAQRKKVLEYANKARWKTVRKLLKEYRVVDPKTCNKFCTDEQTAAQVEIWKLTGDL